ncbi:MAG: CPBP family glutamic-type intramembrane protease [Dysgonomonas sp.]
MSVDYILGFLRKPFILDKDIIKIDSLFEIFKISIIGYLLLISILIVVSMVVRVPLAMMGLMPSEPPIDINPRYIILACLLAPIYEELIFRLSLRFKPIYLLISITLFTLLILKRQIGLPFGLIASSLVLLIGSYLLFVDKRLGICNKLGVFWQNHYSIVFYSSVLIFGLLHIFNYQNLTWKHYLLSPLIVLPQIIMGLFWGYIRLKYDKGLYISILMHLFNNITSTAIRFFTIGILFWP